jgi:orotate phosphoribosyltransferase
MQDFQKEFIGFAIECGVLRFGEFTLKSGRISPYFFNTGLFDSGSRLGRLGYFYARRLVHCGLDFDVLYGPAYKGIPLACATAIALADQTGREAPFAFNRKEAKDHGEGGCLVGAPVKGRVLIVDDVITAGTSVRESVDIIRAAGAQPCGVLIALDRQEKGRNGTSAIAEIGRSYGLPVIAIVTLADVLDYLQQTGGRADCVAAIRAYQTEYGEGDQ